MSKCKGCGREIVWAKTASGKNIPLERVAKGYELSGEQAVEIGTMSGVHISHFLTCPKANDFSGSKPKQGSLF
jgi:hypothetical protein